MVIESKGSFPRSGSGSESDLVELSCELPSVISGLNEVPLRSLGPARRPRFEQDELTLPASPTTTPCMNAFPRQKLLVVVAGFAIGCADDGSKSSVENDDAGQWQKRVFVTSGSYDGNLAVAGGGATGVQGADNLCQLASDAAGLGGRFKAWISDSRTGALSRIEDVGPWYLTSRPGSTKAFNNKANLATAPMTTIVYDENGNTIPTPRFDTGTVWTGTSGGGVASGKSCANWSSAAADAQGTAGDPHVATRWTAYSSALDCPARARLYCIEQ